MPQETKSVAELADKHAIDFITKHTKFEIDGKVCRALVESFIAFEREASGADLESQLNLSYELGQVVVFEALANELEK